MDLKDFEIMAPVGSRESLAAAIQAGADSIYFGIENLNMRARSANTFTIEDLREIAQTCDEHDMKSYLTVNTIIYDQDLALMRTIVDAAKSAGISAVIAADVAGMSYARQIGQEVHLSTQRKAYSYRNVLSRCSLYGSVGKMLSFSARDEPLCQPGCLHAGVPSLLHGA